MKKYFPQDFEQKWADGWVKNGLFQNTVEQDGVTDTNKMYLLYAFAYPSGSGLHVGHVEPVTALDILARYYRSIGKKVFFPVGWDAFGLPAENYAVKTGIPPVKTTTDAISTFKKQIRRIGVSYDWETEIATCHPGYYRFTQWLFLQLYKKGLAYKKKAPVNWCPSCQTVLANEQVIEGRCERCDTEVIQKDMNQWFFKITTYQDELIEGLDSVDWPEATKAQQLNWIGKSEGLRETWKVKDMDVQIDTFTTWPHTTWGATFIVAAPEHPVIAELVKGLPQEREVHAFCKKIIDEKAGGVRQEDKEKRGIFTGRYAINPLTGWEMPIYVGNFAIMNYGTGIVKACPAHDERDFEFAKKYNLPIKKVIDSGNPDQGELYVGQGKMVNAGDLTGMDSEEAKVKIMETSVKMGYGKPMTTYKLRDWLISRQRYWGAPIPIVYDPEGNPHPVRDEHLPWLLPTDVDFKPTGESPLRGSKEFQDRVEKLYGIGWTPEYDTMDTFVDSSWYYLRYTDPRNEEEFAQKSQIKKWMPVDFYMIGPEHIVLHLLYSRFFTKFLRDEGYITEGEPFSKMRHQGMILGPDHRKMSKSKGNVINPDDVIKEYGADTLRMYEMFLGPIDADKPWNVKSVQGQYRFLKRVWNLYQSRPWQNDARNPKKSSLSIKLHATIKKVGEDIESLKFNTAIAALMELLNAIDDSFSKQDARMFLKLLSPFAPFLTEELWHEVMEEKDSIHLVAWPKVDTKELSISHIRIPVQISGKVRDSIEMEVDASEDEAKEVALQSDRVQKFLEGKPVRKVIYVKGKILNLVV